MPIQLILSYFRRAKLRTTFLMISISIAFFLYGTLAGTQRLLNPESSATISNELIVRNKINLIQSLPIAYRDRIAGIDHVTSVTTVNLFGGYFREETNPLSTIMVDAPSYLLQIGPDFTLPPDVTRRFLETRDGILIDRETAQRYGFKVGDKIPITGQIYTLKRGEKRLTFTLVGIYSGSDGAGVSGGIAHYAFLNENLGSIRDRVHWFAIKTDVAANNDKVSASIDRTFSNSDAQTQTEPASAMAKAFLAQLGDLNLIIFSVVAASLATIFMIVGNSIALAVRRRSQDMGVLRALGFSATSVGAGVVLETLLFFVVGGAVGLLAASAAVSVFAAQFLRQPIVWDFLPATVLLGGGGLMIVLTALTSVLPAIRALRLSPAAAFSRN